MALDGAIADALEWLASRPRPHRQAVASSGPKSKALSFPVQADKPRDHADGRWDAVQVRGGENSGG